MFKKGTKAIEIRRATPLDLPQLERLFQVTRQHTFVGRREKFQRSDYQKSTADDQVWIAESKGEIIGFVSLYEADNFIHNLFVDPKHQCKGIGSQLLKTAETNLTPPMTLKISLDNADVGQFYEKHGWFKVSKHNDAKEPYFLYKKI